MKKTLLFIVLLAMGCKSNSDKHIEFIEGYWEIESVYKDNQLLRTCLLYTSPSPRDRTRSRMPSSA